VGSRDLLLTVVPTQPQDEGEPVLTVTTLSQQPAVSNSSKGAGKKGAAAGSTASAAAVKVVLEADTVAEHALQVSRMLPGGLAVLGVYLFAAESGYTSALPELCAALGSIATDAAAATADVATAGAASAIAAAAAAAMAGCGNAQQQQQQQLVPALSPVTELLLLHVDSGARKHTLRSMPAGAPAVKSSLRPVELRFGGGSLGSLVMLRCRHAFDVVLPAFDDSSTLQQLLASAAAREGVRVRAAAAALGGRLPHSPSQPLGDALAGTACSTTLCGGGASSSTTPNAGSDAAATTTPAAAWVDLYCLPQASVALSKVAAAAAAAAVHGRVRLQGCVQALSVAHRRESVGRALEELRADVARSLAARLQLLADDILDAAACDDNDDAAHAAASAAAVGTRGGGGGGSSSVGASGGVLQAHPAHPLLQTAGSASRAVRAALPRRVLLPWSSLGSVSACDYLLGGEDTSAAADRGTALLQLQGVTADAVVLLEAAPTTTGRGAEQQGRQAVKGSSYSQTVGGSGGCSSGSAGGGGGGGSCSTPLLAGAAAAAVAAMAMAFGFLQLGS
jgi:Odorant response abnormal 4-like